MKSKATRKEKYFSADDDGLFLKYANCLLRYIGLKLARKVKTLRYTSGHKSYTRAIIKVKKDDFTSKKLQTEKRAK